MIQAIWRRSRPFPNPKFKWLITIVSGVLVVSLGVIGIKSARPKIISPLPDPPARKNNWIPWLDKKLDPQVLKKTVSALAEKNWRNYSVLVWDLGEFRMEINESVIFTAASVNKLPILAALYTLAGSGKIDLDQKITLQAADIQNFGTGQMRYDPPGTVYSLKTLAKLMMQQSDNTAAYILANYTIGYPQLQLLIKQWGLVQTDMINNKTSNKDIGLLIKKIYTGEIADPALTQEMLALMKDSDFEDRLPARLPGTARVHHKIGTEIGFVHDAGLVTDGELHYYIGVFTSDITDEQKTAELIAEISKTVYYFLKD